MFRNFLGILKNTKSAFLLFLLLLLAPSLTAATRGEDDYTSATQVIDRLLPVWRDTADPQEKHNLGEYLLRLADRYWRHDAIEAITLGDRLKATEIHVPDKATTITIQPIFDFDEELADGLSSYPGWLTRRITKNRVEVWCPGDGWLFDGKGRLLHHAHVPRRDGEGREWFGAFLPDGRWVTTDLWDTDRQLHFYSSEGKFIRSIESPQLPGSPDWARSDRRGKGWVMQIITNHGSYFSVDPDGNVRVLQIADPWRLTYPRALGSRRYALIPAEDDSRWLIRYAPGHGPTVEYPNYRIQIGAIDNQVAGLGQIDEESAKQGLPGEYAINVFNGTRNMGFWPHSHRAFIARQNQGDNNYDTWFIDEKGQLDAWIHAERFADARDGRSMLFETQDGRVVTLSPKFKIKQISRFTTADRVQLTVEQLFDDLGLGLFRDGDRLILGRYQR